MNFHIFLQRYDFFDELAKKLLSAIKVILNAVVFCYLSMYTDGQIFFAIVH